MSNQSKSYKIKTMCTIYLSQPSEIKTGYKMLVQRISDGALFSSFTGEPYNIGKVHKAPDYCKRIINWNADLDDFSLKSCTFYNEEFNGYSAAFIKLADAINYVLFPMNVLHQYETEYKIVIVKITFTEDVFKGYYSGNVIAGNNVESIKVLSDSYIRKIKSKISNLERTY